MSKQIKASQLDFYLQHNLNVLLRGEKGCGKTTMILDCLKRNNIKYKYFSAATMDPWTDFIGVPKEVKDPVTGKSHLALIKPKGFADGDVEVIVFDEFNRSRPKVRNAVMELIQFQSINGEVFPNLKCVWAMINPEDENHTYDVETLDPAQIDRFHIILDVPYQPDLKYFKDKFGAEMAKPALEWWQELSAEGKKICSPRRLDVALEIYNLEGDMRDVLGSKVNVSSLRTHIEQGSSLAKLKRFVKDDDKEGLREYLRNENNYSTALPYILKHKELLVYSVPVMEEEKVASLMSENETVKTMVFDNPRDFIEVIRPLAMQENTEISALAKKAIIEKCPDIQRSDYPLGAPFISSTNIKTILNPSKTPDDLVAELVKYVPGQQVQASDKFFAGYDASLLNLPTQVEVKLLYNSLLGFAVLNQTIDTAHALVALSTRIAEASTPADIAANMPELNGLFNWGFLHLHVYATALNEHDRVEKAYQKSILKPEDKAFIVKQTPIGV